MKIISTIALVIFSISIAQAKIYKCVNSDNEVNYTKTPCKLKSNSSQITADKLTDNQKKAQADKKVQDERNNESAKREFERMNYGYIHLHR